MSIDDSPIVLAYSGGLDTSFCIPWLKQQLKREVITVTVDTGGIDKKHADILQDRAFIISHNTPDSLLIEIFTNDGAGTLVVNNIEMLSSSEQLGDK